MDDTIKTSAQFNNCAFHTLTPFIAAFINPKSTNNFNFQFLEVIATEPQQEAFRQTLGYRYFRQAFAEYYHLELNQELDQRITSLLSGSFIPLICKYYLALYYV